jgi:hypothetical protein
MNLKGYFHRIILGGVLATGLSVAGCTVHAGYYDVDHRDYHHWSDAEREPYGRWEAENHRQHEDYDKLKKEDKQAYWDWRHDHP